MNYLNELIFGKTVTVKDRAYAKVNLFLDVVGKRADGYHDIESYMHSVSLCDDITVEAALSDKIEIEISVFGNDSVPSDGRNIAYKAAKAFCEWNKAKLAVKITIVKRIPSSAGLAGGSSDAAAVLRCLNAMLSNLMKPEELVMLASGLGADVPYCLFGGTKLCEGKGDVLTECEMNKKLYFVIAKGDEEVSTPHAYSKLDNMFGNFESFIDPAARTSRSMLISGMESGRIKEIACGLHNIFEYAMLDECPQAKRLIEILMSEGAVNAIMSGSGPSVFGIFENSDDARRVALQMGDIAFYAESVD